MNERERELIALFIVGAALGFVAIAIAEAWIVASDRADRVRIREEFLRCLAELRPISTRRAQIDAGAASVQNFTETATETAT